MRWLINLAARVMGRLESASELSLYTKKCKTLTVEQAEALAKTRYEGYLNLDGLTTLTPEVAEALAKTRGRISLRGRGLKTITPEVRKVLQVNPRIAFPQRIGDGSNPVDQATPLL